MKIENIDLQDKNNIGKTQLIGDSRNKKNTFSS